jgi:RNA polymerase sigma-70 factor (sigma-E family)
MGMGAPEGFAEFVAGASHRLLRTAYLLTQDWGAAEDLLQTALARAWRVWGRVQGDPEPYVRRILVNTHASWWRRRWRGETPSDALPDRAEPGDPHQAVDDRERLWRAIRVLPPRQRIVLVLRYFEDLTEAQVAETLCCSVGTVKSHTSRAIARLRLDPTLTAEETLR